MKLPDFHYLSPETLEEAVALLAAGDGDAKIISGGQSLLPMMAFRMVQPTTLVDLRKIPGLDRIELGEKVVLGARVTWSAIERDSRLIEGHPLLREMVRHIAHYQIRNRGTVGGSLAHADPAAEFAAVALSCEASVAITGKDGPRILPVDELLLAPLVTALEEDEIITAVEFPRWKPGRRFGFKEFSRRKGDFAIAGAVVHFDIDSGRRIANPAIVGFGLGDTAMRLAEAEEHLDGRELTPDALQEAARKGAGSAEVQSDQQADARYRRALLETMLLRALTMAATDESS